MPARRIEMSLLLCLDALLAEKSVTRAAQRLGMSQPGMSNALARLRRLTRDPLLVRTGLGMDLTPRASELRGLVGTGLGVLDEIFADPRPFEPARAEGGLSVAMADSMATLLGPRLLALVERQAPQLAVTIQRLDPVNLPAMLVDGRCDFAVGYMTTIPEQMHAVELISQSLSVIRAQRHPSIGRTLDLDAYLAARHVLTNVPYGWPSWTDSSVTQALAARGLTRRVGARVDSIVFAPDIVAASEMLCTLPTWMARRSAGSLALRIHPMPFDAPPFKTHLIWHERGHRPALQGWARALLRRVVAEVGAASATRDGLPHFD